MVWFLTPNVIAVYCHDKIFGFFAALLTSLVEVTPVPRTPTFVGGVAVLTGGAGTALTSHLLFLFFVSSPGSKKAEKIRLKKKGTSETPLWGCKKSRISYVRFVKRMLRRGQQGGKTKYDLRLRGRQ